MDYGIFEPDDAKNGKLSVIWPGLWRKPKGYGPIELIKRYADLAPMVIRYLHGITVFFAPLTGDRQLRRHVEGSIGWNLRTNHPSFGFLFPADNRIGRSRTASNVRLNVWASEEIKGLDPTIEK